MLSPAPGLSPLQAASMIELTQLCRTFMLGDQAVHALDNINLSIGAGE